MINHSPESTTDAIDKKITDAGFWTCVSIVHDVSYEAEFTGGRKAVRAVEHT